MGLSGYLARQGTLYVSEVVAGLHLKGALLLHGVANRDDLIKLVKSTL